MGEERHCSLCGAVLPSDGQDGFCPKCVIGVVSGDVPSPARALAPEPQRQPDRRPAVMAVGAVALVAATAWLTLMWIPPPPPPSLARFVVATPADGDLRTGGDHPEVAISADGSRIVYVGRGSERRRQLYLREIGRVEARPMAGTEGGTSPVFSPNGEWVGFLQGDSTLRRVSVLGSRAQAVFEADSAVRGLTRGPDDTIVFGTPNGLWLVSAWGDEPRPLTTVSSEHEAHLWPDILPNRSGVLYTVWSGSLEDSRLEVLSLDTGEVRHLLQGGSHPRYSPTGHIVYGGGGALGAVGFDLATLTLTNRAAVPVLDHVNTNARSGAASFGLSHDGSLVYVSGPATEASRPARLVYMDRDGRQEPLGLPVRNYAWPRISPNGRRLAVTIAEPGNTDVWIVDPERETLTRMTFDEADDLYPAWTPDGDQLVFASQRAESVQLFTTAAGETGTAQPLIEASIATVPASFSSDGRQLVVEERAGGRGRGLALLGMEGAEALEPLLDTEFAEGNPAISPDGRWIAYESDESGRFEVYVRPFPAVDEGKWVISRAGGTRPDPVATLT
jgi:Tol biopolymer transport system component